MSIFRLPLVLRSILRPASWSAGLTAVLAIAANAAGQVAMPSGIVHRIIHESLTTTSGDPLVVDDDRAIVFDRSGGLPQAVPVAEVLAIVVGPVAERDVDAVVRTAARRAGDDAEIVSPFLEFTDGQRLPGSLHPASDGRPVWRSAWVRDVPFDLDRIRSIRFEEGAPMIRSDSADVVVLSNGDQLRGLVEDVGLDVVVEVDAQDGGDPRRISVPIHRVASISLVNPTEPTQGALTWLRGGHRIGSESVRVDDDGYVRLVRPTLGGDLAEIPSEFLLATTPHAERIVPLSSTSVAVDPGRAAGVRPWIPPIRRAVGHHPLDAAPLRLDGPLRATFTLPADAERVAMTLERPGDSGGGRVEVIISDGDRERERRVLDLEHPVIALVVPVDSGRLVVEIDDAGDGPFGDALLLREAIVVRAGN
jgi:hypothetical protein